MSEPLLVTGGVLGGRPAELLVAGGVVAAVGPPGAARRQALGPARRARAVDVGGATLLPGLHDHHVHLRAWAAAATSVRVGPPEVVDAAGLAAALASAPASAGSWIRAVGYHESVAGPLDRLVLDRLVPDRPLRVQHRGGGLWVLNSAALAAVGLHGGGVGDHDGDGPPAGMGRDAAGRPTGLLWRSDDWLGRRVPRPPGGSARLLALAGEAARRGVTGFTDATPGRDAADLAALAALVEPSAGGPSDAIGQRLHLMVDADVADGLGAGWPGPRSAAVTLGPQKVLLDDDRLPHPDALGIEIARSHRRGRPVAVHCVTRVQAVVALAAFEAAGSLAGDRIEHGAVLHPAQVPQLRALGLTVVTQPGFIASRGDRYLADVDPVDRDDLWRVRSLVEGGVAVAAGSDAPHGPSDPWAAVEAAATRRTAAGARLGAGEAVDAATAVALWAGTPEDPGRRRSLAAGGVADICAVALAEDSDGRLCADVRLTVAAGRVLHHA